MLKIKDNVDLKELEKIGFYPEEFIDDKVATLFDLIQADLVEKV